MLDGWLVVGGKILNIDRNSAAYIHSVTI